MTINRNRRYFESLTDRNVPKRDRSRRTIRRERFYETGR